MRGLGNDFNNWNVGLENHHLRSGRLDVENW
jgi:hypothetical protein